MGDKVEIVKLDIDENPETARAYRVMSVPTLTVFKGGEPVQSVAGARPKGDLVKLIESRCSDLPAFRRRASRVRVAMAGRLSFRPMFSWLRPGIRRASPR